MSAKRIYFVTTTQKIRAPGCHSHADGQVNYNYNFETDNYLTLDDLAEALKYGPVVGNRLVSDKQNTPERVFNIIGRNRTMINLPGIAFIQEPELSFSERDLKEGGVDFRDLKMMRGGRRAER